MTLHHHRPALPRPPMPPPKDDDLDVDLGRWDHLRRVGAVLGLLGAIGLVVVGFGALVTVGCGLCAIGCAP